MGDKVPDLSGLFLRGYGSQAHTKNNGVNIGVTETIHTSGALGTVQGDATRESGGTGYISIASAQDLGNFALLDGGGVFSKSINSMRTFPPSGQNMIGDLHNKYYGFESRVEMNLNNAMPTSNEIRPVNMAVRYLIRALP